MESLDYSPEFTATRAELNHHWWTHVSNCPTCKPYLTRRLTKFVVSQVCPIGRKNCWQWIEHHLMPDEDLQ